jgi:hypothetical protein
MRVGLAFVSVVAAVSIAACSSTTTGDGSPGSSPSPVAPSGDAGPAADSATSDGGPSAATPAASTKEADVDINGTCSTFTACGGSPQGTYDYASGCVANVFSAAEAQCPTLDTTNAKVRVTGSLYFVGPALTRDAIVKISGSITVPVTCSMGQCAAVEAALKGSFDSISCTGAAACTCTIANTEIVKNATTFSVSGNTVTTGDGETYQICAQADSLRYTGNSLGSEDGHWELTKR